MPETGNPPTASFRLMLSDLLWGQAWLLLRNKAVLLMYFSLTVGLVFGLLPEAIKNPSVMADPRPIFLLLVGAWVPLGTYWQTKKLFDSLKPMQLEKQFVFQPDRLVMLDGVSEAQVSWEAVPMVVETSRAFHIFIQSNIFHYVPLRGFSTTTQVAEARRVLREALGSNAQVR